MQQFEADAIGRRIAQARKEAGLRNQQELADLLGVTMRSVQGYEAGDVIPYRYFRRLEEITGKPLSWFLRGDEHEREEDVRTRLDQIAEQLERLEDVTQWVDIGADVMQDARTRLGLSRETLAHQLGVSSKTYERWEKRGAVPRHEAEAVADLLGLQIVIPARASAGPQRPSGLDEIRAEVAAVQASVDALERLVRERLALPPVDEDREDPGERRPVRSRGTRRK